jgi:hypothetical protein
MLGKKKEKEKEKEKVNTTGDLLVTKCAAVKSSSSSFGGLIPAPRCKKGNNEIKAYEENNSPRN